MGLRGGVWLEVLTDDLASENRAVFMVIARTQPAVRRLSTV